MNIKCSPIHGTILIHMDTQKKILLFIYTSYWQEKVNEKMNKLTTIIWTDYSHTEWHEIPCSGWRLNIFHGRLFRISDLCHTNWFRKLNQRPASNFYFEHPFFSLYMRICRSERFLIIRILHYRIKRSSYKYRHFLFIS